MKTVVAVVAVLGAIFLLVTILFVVFVTVGILCSRSCSDSLHIQLKSQLEHVTGVLNRINVDYWLDFGTALGHHRDQNIIKGDIDTDVGILSKDLGSVVSALRSLEPEYYLITKSKKIDGRDNVLGAVLSSNNNIQLDLYVYDEKDDMLELYDYGQLLITPRDVVFPLKNEEFCSIPVKVVNKPHDFLKQRYGDTYMTPIANDKGPLAPKKNVITKAMLTSAITWRELLRIKRTDADISKKISPEDAQKILI